MAGRRRGAGGPLESGLLLRPPDRQLRYPVAHRLLDWSAGHRDGRAEARRLAGADASAASRPPAGGMWLARNAWTYLERDRREVLCWRTAVAGTDQRQRMLTDAVRHAEAVLAAAQATRAALPDAPPADELLVRGPAEAADADAVVRARRLAEHRRRLAVVDAEIARARTDLATAAGGLSEARATLTTAHELARTRSQRLQRFYERRANVYRRAYLRALGRAGIPAGDDDPAARALRASTTVPLPPWLGEPVPS